MSIAFISQELDNEIDALLQNFKLGGCLFQLIDGYIEQIIYEFLVIKIIQASIKTACQSFIISRFSVLSSH